MNINKLKYEAAQLAISSLESDKEYKIDRDDVIYALMACGFEVHNGQKYYEENELIKCFDDLYFNKKCEVEE